MYKRRASLTQAQAVAVVAEAAEAQAAAQVVARVVAQAEDVQEGGQADQVLAREESAQAAQAAHRLLHTSPSPRDS